jgi:hypothetical protein
LAKPQVLSVKTLRLTGTVPMLLFSKVNALDLLGSVLLGLSNFIIVHLIRYSPQLELGSVINHLA